MSGEKRSFWDGFKGEARTSANDSSATGGLSPAAPTTEQDGSSRTNRGRHRHTRQLEPTEGVYVPLPAAPSSWEEWREDKPLLAKYNDIFKRYAGKNLKERVEAYQRIAFEDRQGEVATKMASPYRQLRDNSFKYRRFSEAMQWACAMMQDVPAAITNADRKKYNRIIDGLDEQKKKHDLVKLEIEPEEKPELFAVFGSNWSLEEVAKLAEHEKPDKAYKSFEITSQGFMYYTLNGGSERFPDAKSAVRFVGFDGTVLSEFALPHDIYRMYTSPVVSGFTVMSSDCKLYSYDAQGNLAYSEDLGPIHDTKNYIRCVAHSEGFGKFLVTAVDEAWCFDSGGHDLWAVEASPKEGWQKVYERVGARGDKVAVHNSLSCLGLGLPVTPGEVKERFRQMALQWHPDRNPDPRAHEMMIEIRNAFEILTGLDAQNVLRGLTQVERTYRKPVFQQQVEFAPGVNFTISMEMGGPGEDWIYAVGFKADGGGVYLGAYSGRVMEMNERGSVERIFDVGNIPRNIVDTGSRLYIETDTRLYILAGESLVDVKDIYGAGEVIVEGNGFWYLSDKELRLFDANGAELGGVTTRDPIRAFYFAGDKLVLETRQHRAWIGWSGRDRLAQIERGRWEE